MTDNLFNNWRELARLDYFELLPDGRLKLVVDGLDGLVDFHTHLGMTFLLAPPVDYRKKTSEVKHHFKANLKVDLNVYSGQNLFNERPKWAIQDYLPCILVPFRMGIHQTHTIPNFLHEMDALNIAQSVILCIDVVRFSNNSDRTANALADTPRLIFYCSVHPKDPRAEEKMQAYLKAGARGMKIHPEAQLVAANADVMLKHLRLWNKLSRGKPILFHSGYNGFEPKWASKYSRIELYEPAAETLGNTPCILGHSAMNEYKRAVEIAFKFPNVYLETSGQPKDHLKYMLDKMGDDHLLFGSDWPVYPQALPLAKVLLATEDAPSSRVKILRDNAQRLLTSS